MIPMSGVGVFHRWHFTVTGSDIRVLYLNVISRFSMIKHYMKYFFEDF